MTKHRYRGRLLILAAVGVMLVCDASQAVGQTARAYLNAPMSDLLMYSYTGVRSNTGGDDALPFNGVQTRNQTQSLIYSHIMDIFGRTGGPGVILPYMDLLSFNTDTDVIMRRAGGLGDPLLTFDVNIFGAPALRWEDFKGWKPEPYLSLHTAVSFPLGLYDPSEEVNLGSNRYSFKVLLNYSYTGDEGKSWFDVYGGLRAFTTNSNFLNGNDLRQAPLGLFEAHYSRLVYERAWLGAGLMSTFGGAVDVNDQLVTPFQRTLRVGFSGGTPLWKGGTAIIGVNGTVARSQGASQDMVYILQVIQLL